MAQLIWFVTIIIAFSTFNQSCASKRVLFNFGDSNSDTGSGMAANGDSSKTGRYCNGRLYIDFLCERLNRTYLDPYLESSGLHFRQGANFAVGGATAVANSATFPLPVQVLQFSHFLARTRELKLQGKGPLITDKEFRNAIYSIDIGQNDLSFVLRRNLSTIIHERIPIFIENIETAIQDLYKLGGRKFVVYNTGPIGCLPSVVNCTRGPLDEVGCMSVYNDVAKVFNEGLSHMCTKLRSELKNGTIVYTNMYAIKYDLIANATKYGFESPLSCNPNKTVSGNPSTWVIWDTIHYTEAGNEFVASKILSGNYSQPPIKLIDLFNLEA